MQLVIEPTAPVTLEVHPEHELPRPTHAAAPRLQLACAPPDRASEGEGGALKAALCWVLGAADKTRFSRKLSEAEILARTHYFKVYSIDLERWYGSFF